MAKLLGDSKIARSAVCLCHAFNLVLLLDGEAVGRFLGTIHDFISQTFSDRLDVSEGAVPSASCNQIDCLIHAPKGRYIHCLTPDNSSGTHSGRIFTWPTILDSKHEDLNRVVVSQEVNDLKGVFDDADSHHLLSVVATMHHQRTAESLNYRAKCLAEAFLLVPALGVREVGLARLNVVLQTEIGDRHVIIGPTSKELGFRGHC